MASEAEVGNDGTASLIVLGRLLLAALLAGAALGALLVVCRFGDDAADVWPLAAMVGMVVALPVQVVNAGVLALVRRRRPGLALSRLRGALVPVPVLGAAGVCAAFGFAPAWVALAGGLALLAAWIGAPWCLAPLESP